MLYALLFLPALVAIAFVLRPRRHRVLAESAGTTPLAPEDPFAALDAVLAQLEQATLDERSVDELERLADELERVGESLQPALVHGHDVEADVELR